MSKKQWGHGHHTGKKEGIIEGANQGLETGQEIGEQVGSFFLAQKMKVLLTALHVEHENDGGIAYSIIAGIIDDIICQHLPDDAI